jgi:hypothetical protein
MQLKSAATLVQLMLDVDIVGCQVGYRLSAGKGAGVAEVQRASLTCLA